MTLVIKVLTVYVGDQCRSAPRGRLCLASRGAAKNLCNRAGPIYNAA